MRVAAALISLVCIGGVVILSTGFRPHAHVRLHRPQSFERGVPTVDPRGSVDGPAFRDADPGDASNVIDVLRPRVVVLPSGQRITAVNATVDGVTRLVRCRVVSERAPRILHFPSFASSEEAAALIDVGEVHLTRSGVGVPGSSGTNRVRSSWGTRLASKDPRVRRIDQRILATFQRRFSGTHAERLYLLRYTENQSYAPHGDSMGGVSSPIYQRALRARRKKRAQEERTGGTAPSRAHVSRPFTDRAVTFLLYLGAPRRGGNTSLIHVDASVAPRLDLAAMPDDEALLGLPTPAAAAPRGTDACDPGFRLQVQPRVGDAIAFYDLQESGRADYHAEHAGCPVIDGVKWMVTKWLHAVLPLD